MHDLSSSEIDDLAGPKLIAILLGAALALPPKAAAPLSEPIDKFFLRFRIPALELLLVELRRFGPAASLPSSSSSSSSRRRFSARRSGAGGVGADDEEVAAASD